MEIPLPWLIVSGVFFATGILAFLAMAIVLVRLLKLVQELAPKVNGMVDRIDEVSKKVDSISTTVQSTVQNMGGRANHLVNTFESVASASAPILGKVGTYLAIGSAVLKFVRDFQRTRETASHQAVDMPREKEA